MKYQYLFLFCLLAFISSCVKTVGTEPEETGPAERTLLIYMAADNNLSSYALDNLATIQSTLQGSKTIRNKHVIVYLDVPNENPLLLRIHAKGRQTVRQFSEPLNSSSPEVLSAVIEETISRFPADKYSLVLWSHGTAWLPANSGFLTKTRAGRPESWPETKAFGMDIGTVPTAYMEISELKRAIPDGIFDYILFDACYMGSAEVHYALKNKADYIVSSPTEVLATGFPYENIMEELLAETPDLESVCRAYYEHYLTDSYPLRRSASVSLVRTAGLGELAETVGTIIKTATEHNPGLFEHFNPASVQHFDLYRNHFLFDLDHFVESIGTVQQYTAFRNVLSRTVLFEAHTPYFFTTPIDRCSGLSVYIPVTAYDAHNAFYHTLDWSQAVYE